MAAQRWRRRGRSTPATRRSCTRGKSLFCRSGRHLEISSKKANSAPQMDPGEDTNSSVPCAEGIGMPTRSS